MGRWLVVLCIGSMTVLAYAQDVTGQMLIPLNAARDAAGVPPLVVNSALVLTAQQHSDDMAAGGFLSHTGSDGSQFWERMRQNGYPLVTGAENVLYRWDTDVQGAYQQWYESDGHRVNMLNADYTEIGVAYGVGADGRYYFTMVLGAQANGVIQPTAMVAPPTLTDVPPTPTAVPPTLAPVPTLSPPILPTTAPLPTLTTLPASVLPTTVALEPTPSDPVDFQLVWDTRSFSLVNVSGGMLDLQGLQFESDEGVFSITNWQTPDLSAPLWGFPVDGCLQVWGLGYSALLEKPESCRFRHAWIAVSEDRLFWQGVPQFTVVNRGRVVAVCPVASGVCDVRLDGVVSAPLSPPDVSQARPDVTEIGAVRLLYDSQSLTISNVSGGVVNLRGLRLQSERGSLPIGAWENEFLSADLGAFPANDCLQAWTLDVVDPPTPATCDTRHAWIALTDARLVWAGVSQFDVYQNDTWLATCPVAEGRCAVQVR